MDKTILISFPELFSNKDIQVKKIIIPKIQRDYAQGRQDDHATRVRTRFLDAIYNGITSGHGLTLDFIYGHNDNGLFIPLDGQQRLTTLFLLYWYAARREQRGDAGFLHSFTYQTRYSARDFCGKLADEDFNPFILGYKGSLSAEIKDQPWFAGDWMHDGTISSMLVMLDAIDKNFAGVEGLFDKLNTINFYFISLESLKLTDDIYTKMNSRGKPLTDFENFKAELEKTLNQVDPDVAKTIAEKIDTKWTDLLWLYADGKDNTDGRPSTDDAFLRYFRFICDILCYKSNNSPKETDEFKLLTKYFTGPEAKNNAVILQQFFDLWIQTGLTDHGKNMEGFFNTFACVDNHKEGKVKLAKGYDTDLFKDCINNYSELIGNRNRRFPLNKIILLYAVIVYLKHEKDMTKEDFVHRLRIVNNLVLNSSDEISDSETRVGGNRMPAILEQVKSIISKGVISDNIVIDGKPNSHNFNLAQLIEERKKQTFLHDHPEFREDLAQFEDHELLYGRVAIVGLEHHDLFEPFEKLFQCNWDLVDRALFAMGDYSQRDKDWRIQVGTSNKSLPQAWINLFHNNKEDELMKTKRCMIKLLSDLGNDVTDQHLTQIIQDYLTDAEKRKHFDWIYYYVKYPDFRIGRYGKYCQYENNPYDIISIYASQNTSSNSKNLFVDEFKKRCNDTALRFFDDSVYKIDNERDRIVVSQYQEGGSLAELIQIPIEQDNGIDKEDRILKAAQMLNSK